MTRITSSLETEKDSVSLLFLEVSLAPVILAVGRLLAMSHHLSLKQVFACYNCFLSYSSFLS